jgi:uncharacterized protein YndB with AHSA1/START domain
MGQVEYSVWIDAAPEAVWQVYVDPARIPDWQTGRPSVVDVLGQAGEPGSSYRTRRGPLVARTVVVAARAPHELQTRTEAYLGLQLEVTSRLGGRAGGTELQLVVVTHWRRRLGPVARLVELAVLNPGENRKELALLKALVEREASG